MPHPIRELGAITLFAAETLRGLRRGVPVSLVMDQMVSVGVHSLSTTITAGLFVGAIMAIQLDLQLRDFGAQGYLGGLATSVTVRNLGPVLIAFILSGKVGAYTSAELGTMRVTDQIDAIRCLGVSPIEYIIVPRMIAVVLSAFLLLVIGLMVSILGGLLISSLALGINATQYLHTIPRFVSGWSVATGMAKSFVFGSLIGLISCYRGYTTTGGAMGVGNTVRSTSVLNLVCIIVADCFLSWVSSFHDVFHRGAM